ncbi:MAG: serine hydrolase domain-containing protein, partial [Ignavibacteriaceae bacterium]
MKKLYFLLSFLIISSFNLFSQTTPSFVSDSIDNYIKRGMNNWEIPGVAVLIVKDGKVVYEKGFGVKELGKDDLVDKNTLFMIGSNTKAFTGTALAILEHD